MPINVAFHAELETAIRAARSAGEIVAAHYAKGPLPVETKPDDSPVTQADRDADAAIRRILRDAFPMDAILSEETTDDGARLGAARVWIVDPLDGTRDFVQRTDDFAVHVGLAVDGEAVVGAVYLPVSGTLYAAARGEGAWRGHERLHVSSVTDRAAWRLGISRHLLAEALRACLDDAGIGEAQRFRIGASVKHAKVAAGELDAVINLSRGELDWDTCAPEVIVREAGGMYTDGDGRPFRYNQRAIAHARGSIASNGACHAELVALLAPYLPVQAA